MKRILIAYEKYGNRVFDISTEQQRANTYLRLFKERRKEGFYDDLAEVGSRLYTGENVLSAIRILKMRSNYEYERIEEIEVRE